MAQSIIRKLKLEKKIVKMDNRLVNIEAMMQKLLEQNHNTVNITNEIPLLQRVMKQSPESCQTQEMQMCRMIICKIWNISIDKMTKNDCERRCKSLKSSISKAYLPKITNQAENKEATKWSGTW